MLIVHEGDRDRYRQTDRQTERNTDRERERDRDSQRESAQTKTTKQNTWTPLSYYRSLRQWAEHSLSCGHINQTNQDFCRKWSLLTMNHVHFSFKYYGHCDYGNTHTHTHTSVALFGTCYLYIFCWHAWITFSPPPPPHSCAHIHAHPHVQPPPPHQPPHTHMHAHAYAHTHTHAHVRVRSNFYSCHFERQGNAAITLLLAVQKVEHPGGEADGRECAASSWLRLLLQVPPPHGRHCGVRLLRPGAARMGPQPWWREWTGVWVDGTVVASLLRCWIVNAVARVWVLHEHFSVLLNTCVDSSSPCLTFLCAQRWLKWLLTLEVPLSTCW